MLDALNSCDAAAGRASCEQKGGARVSGGSNGQSGELSRMRGLTLPELHDESMEYINRCLNQSRGSLTSETSSSVQNYMLAKEPVELAFKLSLLPLDVVKLPRLSRSFFHDTTIDEIH